MGIDLDAVGSVGWGAWSGSCNLVHFAVSGDLLDSGSGTLSAASLADVAATTTSLPTILSSTVARSTAGDMAIAWSQVDTSSGTAQPLMVEQWTATGGWSSPETVVSSNHFRGDPALGYLPDGRLILLWSESTLDASAVPGMDSNAAAAGQEIVWSIRNPGGWTAPQALTSNGLLDDQPAIAVRSDGTAVAVWRHASAVDLTNPANMDLWYASFDGSTWSQPAVMFDDSNANGRPALTTLDSGDIVAIWLSSTVLTGEDATVCASILHAGAWSIPTTISDTTGTLRQSPRLVTLPDDRVLAFWTEEADKGQTMRMAVRNAISGDWGASTEVLAPQQFIGAPVVTICGSRVDVVWHGIGAGRSSIFSVSRDFANDQGWTVLQELTPAAGENWWPMAAADGSGNLNLAYVAAPASSSGTSILSNAGLSANIQTLTVGQLPDLAVASADISLATTPAVPNQANSILCKSLTKDW